MCRRVQCSQCGKPTFAGCGAHVEQVLGDVPRDQRCRCAETREATPRREGEQRSWLDVLLGR
jgi:hypothetical protein